MMTNLLEREVAIRYIRTLFPDMLSKKLSLSEVSGPHFVRSETCLNDNLSGIESPVSFIPPSIGSRVEIVHSLAKWKRVALKRYAIPVSRGIFVIMNAIRQGEVLDPTHSLHVDQVDYEIRIDEEMRNIEYLHDTVCKIYDVMVQLEIDVCHRHNTERILPSNIYFITSQALEDMYPDLTPESREHMICQKYGAVCITKIGGKLSSGNRHGARSWEYDDWTMNCDIIVWYPVLGQALELSSMGIRVDGRSLQEQALLSGSSIPDTPYHKGILEGTLLLSLGGGIGLSRLCMFLLRKRHIGEVQSSCWDDKTLERCQEQGITLL